MQKIKILAVAPYDGMAEAITAIGRERTDIDLTVQTGDLDTGRKIAVELAHKNYDVIISRGGTAELIRSTVDVPVIDISISGYDILRAIKLAENYLGKFAIAGFSSITNNARILCDLLQYDIDILTFTCEDDVTPVLLAAQKKGCTLVLCDMAGCNAAQKLGMNAILISSGPESIGTSIEEAVKLVHSSFHVHKQKFLFQALLTGEDQEFLIYGPSGSLWFSSLAVDSLNDSFMNLVQNYLKAFLKVPGQTVARQIRDKMYTLSNRHLFYGNEKYTAVIITQKNALLSEEDMGITIYNHSEQLSSDSLGCYSSGKPADNMTRILEEYSKIRLPVLITGEIGTGKDKAASVLYRNGPFSSSPFYVIDCEYMNERKWNSLIDSDSSPLSTAHTTVYIKNPGLLSGNQLEKLFNYMEQTNLCKRNRLIFSLISGSSQPAEYENVRSYLENRLCCLTISLLPLRERIQDFSSITALYLHKLNVSLGKQIIGFDTEAMEHMTAYSWPGNLDQLRHVLKELVVITQTSYISHSDVVQLLNQEPAVSRQQTGKSLNLNQSLDDINYQIILTVLEEEHQNKEKTAQRLGISRSTLWRILKSRE